MKTLQLAIGSLGLAVLFGIGTVSHLVAFLVTPNWFSGAWMALMGPVSLYYCWQAFREGRS